MAKDMELKMNDQAFDLFAPSQSKQEETFLPVIQDASFPVCQDSVCCGCYFMG